VVLGDEGTRADPGESFGCLLPWRLMNMISNSFKTGLVCLASILAVAGSIARAEMIMTAGAVCRSVSGAQAVVIDGMQNGVRNNSASPREVVCSVPRSSGTGIAPMFYVDGQNAASTCTFCEVVIYHYTGVLAASQYFTQCAPPTGPASWDQSVAFPSGLPISPDDYISVQCTLPGNGVLYGTTMIQS
jgi:hypothetical protein